MGTIQYIERLLVHTDAVISNRMLVEQLKKTNTYQPMWIQNVMGVAIFVTHWLRVEMAD